MNWQLNVFSAAESTACQHFDKLNVTRHCEAELVEALLNKYPRADLCNTAKLFHSQ